MVNLSRFCLAIFLVSACLSSYAWTPKVKGVSSATYSAGTTTASATSGISQAGKIAISWDAARQTGATAGQWAQANAASSTIGIKSTASAASKAFALKNFLKTNLYTAGAFIALDYLSEKYGWFESNGELVYYDLDNRTYPAHTSDVYYSNTTHYSGAKYDSPAAVCLTEFSSAFNSPWIYKGISRPFDYTKLQSSANCVRLNTNTGEEDRKGIVYFVKKSECPSQSILDSAGYGCIMLPEKKSVTNPMLDAADLSDAYLTNADAAKLYDAISDVDTVEITQQPQPVVMPSITTTNPDGTVTEETTTITPTAVVTPDNQIAVNYETTTTTNTYQDGDLIDTSTKTTTVNNENTTITNEQPKQQQQQQKTDCDFMPTVCAFLDWFKSDDADLAQQDLSALEVQEIDIQHQNYDITFGVSQCPSPVELTFSSFTTGTYEISYQPFCDFASKFKYIVVALAYLAAGYILVGAIQND